MNAQTKGLLITSLGVLAVVPDALFVRLIDASPLVIAFWRNGLCGLMILAWLWLRTGRNPVGDVLATGWTGLLYGFCASFSAVLFVLAVSLTNVANVVFIIAAMPVFAAFYSWLWMGERLSKRMVWTIFLVAFGIACIAWGSRDGADANLLGDFLALCVAAIFGLGLTAARKARAVSMVPVAAVAHILGAALLLFVINPLPALLGQWPLILLHGGVFIALSTSLLAIGPRFITSAEVALLILLESVLAPLLVWAVLDETPAIAALVGGAVVLATLIVSNAIALRRR